MKVMSLQIVLTRQGRERLDEIQDMDTRKRPTLAYPVLEFVQRNEPVSLQELEAFVMSLPAEIFTGKSLLRRRKDLSGLFEVRWLSFSGPTEGGLILPRGYSIVSSRPMGPERAKETLRQFDERLDQG